MNNFWRKCSNCKQPIDFSTKYWVCNVSTCNRPRTGLVFCSVSCWDAHLPIMRHREAWAEERHSPSPAKNPIDMPKLTQSRPAGKKTVDMKAAKSDARLAVPPRDEILVVSSKVKAYIRARADLNTSASVMEALSDKVRALCDRAIRSAVKNQRKTVLDRDLS